MHSLSLNGVSLRVLVVLVCCLALLATFTSFSHRAYATSVNDLCPKGDPSVVSCLPYSGNQSCVIIIYGDGHQVIKCG